jgi:hypothetical protein
LANSLRADTEIHVDQLNNCRPEDATGNTGSGTHTMQLLVEFTRTLRKMPGFENTQLIVKIDASRIEFKYADHKFNFPLNILYVLTRGESWYNSLGFYETAYEENRRDAETYIQTKMMNLKPSKEIKRKITCTQMNTVQECFTSMFARIKILSRQRILSENEIAELKYYSKKINEQEKICKRELFPKHEDPEKNRYKFKNLYYRF